MASRASSYWPVLIFETLTFSALPCRIHSPARVSVNGPGVTTSQGRGAPLGTDALRYVLTNGERMEVLLPATPPAQRFFRLTSSK